VLGHFGHFGHLGHLGHFASITCLDNNLCFVVVMHTHVNDGTFNWQQKLK